MPYDSEDANSPDAFVHDDPGWTAERLVHQASYKDLGSPTDVEHRFYRHLLSSTTCVASLQDLLRQSSTTTRDYSITVDAFDLMDADPLLGHMLLRFPATLLPLLENAVVRAQRAILLRYQQQQENDDNDEDHMAVAQMTVKGSESGTTGSAASASSAAASNTSGTAAATRVHARLVHLPPYCFQTSLAAMDAQDVGKIVQVTGTVVRTTPIQMYESARTYRCCGTKNGCGRTFTIHADMELRNNNLQPPSRCILLGTDGRKCTGTNIQPVNGGGNGPNSGSVHTDYQEIKIQEAASRIGIGSIPKSLLIKLQHDLVDTCQPGDEVVVVGSLLAQWQDERDVETAAIGMAMSAHSVRVVAEKGNAWKSATTTSSSLSGGNNNGIGEMDKFRKEFESYWSRDESQHNPISARDFIVKAVCPKLYGLHIIKLALLMTLVGGVSADAYNKNDDTNDQHQRQQGHSSQESDAAHYDVNEPQPFVLNIDSREDNHSGPSAAAAYYGGGSNEGSGDGGSAGKRNRSNSKNRNAKGQQVQTRRRDQSHLLLVGDPGTGKSQILRFAAALCPRSVLTTGVGTTSAGLTCAAVRDGNGKEFALEAGALVLADKGVCCIDEFGCIRSQDRTTIHEAMEQQTLSVAKAGIVCKLNCRATIIAVMNPRDCLYDNHASLSTNTGLGTPLLSRFDLIFKLVDASDAERDSKVTTYLLERAIQGAGFDVVDHTDTNETSRKKEEEPWSMEKLRAYISIVKDRFQPAMSDKAAQLLECHYEKCRSSQSNTIPITVRFLESLIRLSQAHARLSFRNTVLLEDAVAVIQLMECSAFCYGGFDGCIDDIDNYMYCDPMTVDFSDEADTDFLCFQYRILNRYGMLHFLDDEKRRKALEALGGLATTSNGGPTFGGPPNCGGDGWHDLESHARNPLGPVAPNQNYSSIPAPNTSGTPSENLPWTQQQPGQHFSPKDQPWADMPMPSLGLTQQPTTGTPSISQDHYGRLHFSSPSYNPASVNRKHTNSTEENSKRPRH